MQSASANRGRALATSILLLAALVLASILSLRDSHPPGPLSRDAPADVFAAGRAMDVLQRILGDGRPHPTGSAANAAVRDRIVDELAALGLEADIRPRFSCNWRTCATVENILARLPGESPEQAVLLSAHYDSVAAGPGASDDGAGVAALIEVARALQAGPPLPRDVWLLFNDGEELGLLGAEAFARSPEFDRIATVVNLEARGTSGASLLIETQQGNADVIAAVRASLERPAGSSLDYEIYKTLPNDTDFTVYRKAGLAGTNFAWARNPAHYHTPLDDLAHLDAGSLQHHGDNTLGMARAMAAAGDALHADHDAQFFDVLGIAMVTWPVGWNLALLVIALLAWGGLMLRQVRAGEARVASLLLAGFGSLLALVLFALAAWALYALLGAAGAMPATWTAQAASLVAGFLLLAALAAGLLARPAVRWLGAPAVVAGSLVPFALVATFTTVAMPGATYMGLVPLLAGALAGHAWLRRPVLYGGIAAIVAAALWSTYSVSSHEAIGHAGLTATTVLAGLVLLPALPVLDGLGRALRWLVFATLAGTLLCAALAIVRPPFDAQAPRPINLVLAGPGERMQVFADDFATEVPGAFLDDAGFDVEVQGILPWMDWSAYPGRAGPALPAPVADVVADEVRDGRRHVRLRLQSRRDADRVGLFLPATAGITALRVRGRELPPPPDYAGDAPWRWISVIGPDADGVEVSFEADPGAAIELYVIDRTHGLPQALDDVLRARDAVAVPIHGGDITLVWSRIELLPDGATGFPPARE